MMMTPFEDRLYAILFYVLAAAVVAGVGIWVLRLSRKAKRDKNRGG
ncbi:hypothetical protein HGI30_11625 [Paenibacillus albicereus]|uniref:Uncharacterized protein n=1 Tax=Paenibacillus albicereus TaxID=2726185 RepID=A0A6H2GXM7_9BACL|nr:hypothetical protein [Paenibacillus albicereus]QJC52142.1 hypothetical protein HGI30_11625 [Paenibacillus albicereus]